jgi:hypothetical protein
MQKHLNADAMFAAICNDFAKIADHQANNKKIPLVNAMMSNFVMCALEDQFLLAFDDQRAVLLLCPKMIIMQDWSTKQDCERKAADRLLVKLRQDHLHLKYVVIENGLSANSQHITNLIDHNIRFILEAKPGDHAHLFAQLVLNYPERGEDHTYIPMCEWSFSQ